jgi:hypothetical protein
MGDLLTKTSFTMRSFTLVFAILATSFLSLNSFRSAGPDGQWKFIEDKSVSFGVDHDEIHLGKNKDQFRFLKLRVTDGPLRVYNMKVHYDNGDVQEVSLRMLIPMNGESRVINLDGGLRHLQKIEFWYETVGFRDGKARLAVWGRR